MHAYFNFTILITSGGGKGGGIRTGLAHKRGGKQDPRGSRRSLWTGNLGSNQRSLNEDATREWGIWGLRYPIFTYK